MKKRRSLLVVLPALFAMTLAGCGGDKGGDTGGGNQEQQETRKDVTGVTLDKTTAKVAPGKTVALTATVAPGDATDKSVTWSSDDETVATVDENGVVTAVAEGTANIKVKTNDGNFETTCVVTVGYTPKITINDTNGTTPTYPTILIGAEYQINAVVTEANGEQGLTDLGLIFTKSSSNENISLSETGLVTGLKKGSCEVTVKSHYDENVSVKVTINVVPEQPALPEKASNDFNLRKTGQLVDGATVMFASTLDDNYYFMGGLSGNIHTPIQTTIESEKLVVPEGAAAFTVVVNGDGTYSFKDENNNYLASGNGKNNYLVRSAEFTPEAKWEIAFGDKGYVDMLSKTETLDDSGVAHNVATLNPNTGNSGGPRFACYKPTSAAGYSKLAIFEADKVLGLSIEQAPTKVKYLEGDEFDATGAQFKVQHSWDEEETIGSDATGLTYDKTEPLTLTDNSVTFSYKGVSVNQPIEVVEKILSSIAVDATNLVKTTYSKNGTVDVTGLVVTATYNAGTDLEREETLELGTGYVLVDTTVGDQPSDSKQITIKAVEDETKTATFTVEVLDKQVVSVTLSGTLTKDDYFTGESLDPTGLSAHIAYDDTTEEDRPLPDAEVTITPAGALTATDVDVKATFGGVDSNTLEGAYSVHDAVLDNIQIATEATNKKFMEKDAFDVTGLVINAYTDQYPTSNPSDVTSSVAYAINNVAIQPGNAIPATAVGEGSIVTVSYTAGEVTKTVSYGIDVEAFNGVKRAVEAIDNLGSAKETAKLTVYGVVTAFKGTNDFIIADADYAVDIYASATTKPEGLKVGDEVKVVSTFQSYNGLPETKTIESIEILTESEGITASVVDVTSKNIYDNTKICTLINVEGELVSSVAAWTSANKVTSAIKVGGEEFTLYLEVQSKTGLATADFNALNSAIKEIPVGGKIKLNKAILSTFNSRQIIICSETTIEDTTAYEASSVSINEEGGVMTVGGETKTFTATMLPTYTKATVAWSVEDITGTNVISVDPATGEVTALSEGTAKVIATASYNDGATTHTVTDEEEITVVGAIELTSIELDLSKLPESYNCVGESVDLDISGLVVTGIYNNNSELTEVLDPSEYTVTPSKTAAGVNDTSITIDVSVKETQIVGQATYNFTIIAMEEKEVIIDGASLATTATTEDTAKTIGGVDMILSAGAKNQGSDASTKSYTDTKKFILIGKSGAHMYNTTAMPGVITGFTMATAAGASEKVTVGVNFSDTAISEYDSTTAWTNENTTLKKDFEYDLSSSLTANCKFFWFQVTNANNAQVQFKITYLAPKAN